MTWFGSNYEITAEASAAYNAAKGLAGEQPADPDDGLYGDPYDDTDRDRLDDR